MLYFIFYSLCYTFRTLLFCLTFDRCLAHFSFVIFSFTFHTLFITFHLFCYCYSPSDSYSVFYNCYNCKERLESLPLTMSKANQLVLQWMESFARVSNKDFEIIGKYLRRRDSFRDMFSHFSTAHFQQTHVNLTRIWTNTATVSDQLNFGTDFSTATCISQRTQTQFERCAKETTICTPQWWSTKPLRPGQDFRHNSTEFESNEFCLDGVRSNCDTTSARLARLVLQEAVLIYIE